MNQKFQKQENPSKCPLQIISNLIQEDFTGENTLNLTNVNTTPLPLGHAGDACFTHRGICLYKQIYH